jgi:hypothetical protein
VGVALRDESLSRAKVVGTVFGVPLLDEQAGSVSLAAARWHRSVSPS